MPEKVPYVQYPEFHIAIYNLSFEAICYNNEYVKSFISLTWSYINIYRHNFYHFNEILNNRNKDYICCCTEKSTVFYKKCVFLQCSIKIVTIYLY